MQASLLEAKAAIAACQKMRAPLLEPPSDPPVAAEGPVTAVRKPDSSQPQLQRLIPVALLTALRLGSAAKQPWLVANAAIEIWNTYLPNLQQQRCAPLYDVLMSATTLLLSQPDVGLLASQLTGLVTASALATEHAALLAILASAPQKGEAAALPAGMAADPPVCCLVQHVCRQVLHICLALYARLKTMTEDNRSCLPCYLLLPRHRKMYLLKQLHKLVCLLSNVTSAACKTFSMLCCTFSCQRSVSHPLVFTHQHWLHACPDAAGGTAESAAAASQPNAISLSEARKLATPMLSATATLAAASVAKPGKGAGKTEAAPGPVPAQALSQLKAAAEACEAVMLKLNTAGNAAGKLPAL